MADLLLSWLNHELKLSTHVTDVETDLASGYLLGEILHRLNHQHNFADFLRSSSADAKILNFCLLEPSLRNLNVKFDANAAAAIMNEKKNAAANLLYQIKIAATRLGRAPGVSTKSLERTSIFPLHNRPVKLAKPAYDTESHRLFEHAVRRHARSIASLQREKDQLAEEASKRQEYRTRMTEQKELLEATKAERLHRAFIHSSYIKEALEETDSPAWRLALQKKNAREQRRAAFLQQLMQKREEADENLTFSLRRKVRCDLDDFDGRERSSPASTGGKVSSRKSVGYGLRSLTTVLGAASDKKKYSTSNLAGSPMNERELYHANVMEMESASGVIKQQRDQREKRRETLSRRRKRFVQECVYTHSRIGTARVTSILEDAVVRETNSEKDIDEEMSRVHVYKEVARENRGMRDQAYANQEEVDSVAAVDRDTSCYHNLLLQFEDNSEMQVIQRTNVLMSVEAADRFLSEQVSAAMMKDMVDFVLFIAGKREQTLYGRDATVFLTPETWSEYKVQFANNCNFAIAPSLPITEVSDHAELLDTQELEQYLSSFRPFHTSSDQQHALSGIPDGELFLGATDAIQDCFVLGEEIKHLRWIARLASQEGDASREASDLETASIESIVPAPTVPSNAHPQLRILIFGPPFAGKETQAKLLGETHNLLVVSVHELIQQTVQKWSEIGRRVETLLTSGEEIPPELYSQLVIDSIREIEAQALTQESNNKAGWVIYDLPATVKHDQHLEEQLTGYVDPTLISSPFDFESIVAPGRSKPALPPTFLHGKSGVDLVFHIDCPVSTILDRCLGRVEDCATGDNHHLAFDSPPDDSIVRYRLQHVNPSAYSSELLSLHCLANDDFSHDHKAWHAKFDTLHEPASTGMTVSEVHEAIAAIVNEFQKEKHAEAESKQQHEEAGELALMAGEEERHRRIDTFEVEIVEAQNVVASAEASVAEAEEAKAKKEEILELRQRLEEAQRQLNAKMVRAKGWVEEELSRCPVPSSKYSGELLPPTAHALAAMWNDMEVEYISAMKTSYALLREQRHSLTQRAQIMTGDFCEFVRRPDQKQEVASLFQKLFNEVVDEMRFDDLTKIELHARTDVLQDELGALVDKKVAANDEELNGMVGNGWMEDACQRVAAIYQMALQAECDRFLISVRVLVDGHYAASSDHSQMKGILETWKAHESQLALACRIYRDPTNDTPPEAPSAPIASGKAPAKGKAKLSAPAVHAAPPASTATSSEDALNESLTMNELIAEYGHVTQRCGAWMEAINPLAIAATEAEPDSGIDFCKVNLLNGIKYEHDLIQRRVRFLQEATEKSCDEITRSMRFVEKTLRDVLVDRKDRELVAIAALVEHIRSAIEAEVALPSFVDTSPEFIQRFPTTVQLREDTMVRVDASRRLLPQSPPDAPPIVEETHALLLTPRQCSVLREALASQTIEHSGLLPLCTLVETMAALASLPDALPEVWRRCPAHVIAEVAAGFTSNQSAFVDIKALVTAMSTRDDLLRQFQADEELQHQQEEHERELLQQQQQSQIANEPTTPSDVAE